MRSINKKGILLTNALSLIIAVAGLALLFFGMWKLYIFAIDSEDTSAKNTVVLIEEKINALIASDQTETKLNIQSFSNENDWFITSFGKGIPVDEKPEKCFFDSCVCVCKSVGSDKIASCQENGFCRKLDVEKITTDKPVFQKELASLIIRYSGEIIHYDHINLDKNMALIPITITKESNNEIKISHYSQDYIDRENELNVNFENSEKGQAISSLNSLLNQIINSPKENVSIEGIKSNALWALLAWNKDELDKPNICISDNCLCACEINTLSGPIDFGYVFNDNWVNSCENNGVCIDTIDKEIKLISISSETSIVIRTEAIPFTKSSLKTNLLDLKISLDSPNIELKYNPNNIVLPIEAYGDLLIPNGN